MYYDEWTKEDLVWKIRRLENQVSDLERENQQKDREIERLEFRIKSELEPMIRARNAAYDAYVTNAERR